MNNAISRLTIRRLLSGGDKYSIPMYQRNYAWDEGEITQLIQDVIDYLSETPNYYIGTLVVFKRTDSRRSVYETIDGQQRLTTLFLLASYLKNEEEKCEVSWYKELAIDFDSREHSQQTLSEIFNGRDPAKVLKPEEINTAILNGYRIIKRILPQKLVESGKTPQEFSDFLFDRVQIMRVMVPKHTDLNHYFEIMNNRGEQLDKHEILKSRMMEALDKDDKESQNCLHIVWEACSNMEKYVQMGFSKEQRNAVFGAKDWSSFDVADFEELREKIGQSDARSRDNTSEQTLDEIIGQTRDDDKPIRGEEVPERFNSVINFPNFLLQVLQLQTKSRVPLDDKRLISTFKSKILKKEDDAAEKVKQFTFDLLRCKFLYDQYVIKREFIKGEDRWSLKRLKRKVDGVSSRTGSGYYVNTFENEDDNRRILMLLSAFHVSTPTLVYKHWLNAALHYLFTRTVDAIPAGAYLNHLESVAKSFVFDRFLSVNDRLDYFDIIFRNKGVCHIRKEALSEEHMESRLSFGNIENNLVFNFLDYLLWVKHQASDDKVKYYEFTFRSSVEHYYPQNPLSGDKRLPTELLDSFGNLCLISHSKNSRLSNHMPAAKREHYFGSKIDSVKQHLMMDYELWNEANIKAHFNEMKSVLLDALEPAERLE